MKSTDAGRIAHFLRGRSQVDRYILLLHYADGLTTHEIGLVLDLSEPQVRARLDALRDQARASLTATRAASTDTHVALSVTA